MGNKKIEKEKKNQQFIDSFIEKYFRLYERDLLIHIKNCIKAFALFFV
jgi:hypothetical protein